MGMAASLVGDDSSVVRPSLHPDIVEHMPAVIDTAASKGVRAAIERRDGPWGDYSQAPPERRPDPSHVIDP